MSAAGLIESHAAKGAVNPYKYVMTDKQIVLEAVSKLPDDISITEIAEDVEILAALQKGEDDITAGRVKTHDEVEKLFGSWISK